MATLTARVRAPALHGAGGWINSDRPLSLSQLRGRVVLLDFWTFCCINCLRVVEELRPLEERFGDRLVVIGIHSPKFPHEGDHGAVVRAVRRHRIHHPVLDDPELEMWQQYGVRAWPTLVVIDPDGYAVGMASGEGNAAALAELIERLLAGSAAPPGPAFQAVQPDATGALAFPGKVCTDGAGRLAIADTGHDRVLLTTLDGQVVQEFTGFDQPQGVRFDGGRLLVCDTVGGRLVAVPLDGSPQTVLSDGMHSPWDVVVEADGDLVVAEAGLHRLLAVPRDGGSFRVLAGTRAEGLRDGPATHAHLAQPSGLAVLSDGGIAIADSEVSALRVLRRGEVTTLVGRGLFVWGSSDGEAKAASLQHPLGVAALDAAGIAVADTFNSRIRIWRDGRLSTVAVQQQLDEPGGLDVLPDGSLVVADTGNHRVVRVDPRGGAVGEIAISGLRGTGSAPDHAADAVAADAVAGEPISGASGERVTVPVRLAAQLELDHSGGPPVRVSLRAEPDTLVGAGPRSWALESLPATLEIQLGAPGSGELRLTVTAATCTDTVCTVVKEERRHPLRVS